MPSWSWCIWTCQPLSVCLRWRQRQCLCLFLCHLCVMKTCSFGFNLIVNCVSCFHFDFFYEYLILIRILAFRFHWYGSNHQEYKKCQGFLTLLVRHNTWSSVTNLWILFMSLSSTIFIMNLYIYIVHWYYQQYSTWYCYHQHSTTTYIINDNNMNLFLLLKQSTTQLKCVYHYKMH